MQRIIAVLIFAACACTAQAGQSKLNLVDEAAFFRSVALVESEGVDATIGDTHLRHKAYGRYQIRKIYVDDVFRIAGKEMVRTWGRRLNERDMFDSEKARWTMRVYLNHYGKAYQRATGRAPDAKVYAMLHKGGPRGWRRSATLAYWHKVNYHYRRTYGS